MHRYDSQSLGKKSVLNHQSPSVIKTVNNQPGFIDHFLAPPYLLESKDNTEPI